MIGLLGLSDETSDAATRPPFRRWGTLLALLLVEGLTLSVSFDSTALAGLPGGASTFLIRNAGSAVRVGSVVLAGFFLVAGAKLRQAGGPDLARLVGRHRYAPFLVAHLAAFGALAGLSVVLFGGAAAAPLHARALVALWLLAMLLTLATWLSTLVPPRVVPMLARQHGSLLGASFVLGATALGVGKLSDHLWLPLRRLTFALSSFVLGLFVAEPVSDPATFAFGARDFVVDIAPQCSGYEGMGLNLVFMLAALWFFRDRLRFPRAWWLLPLGVAASFLVNVARLVALVLVGAYVSPEIGVGGFHSYAGTFLFCCLALSMVALALRSPWLAKDAAGGWPASAKEPLADASNPGAPYLIPFIAMIAAGLLARAFSSAGHEPLYALRPAAGVIALASYRSVYRAPAWRPTWRVSWPAVFVGGLVAALWIGLGRLRPPPGALGGSSVATPVLLLRALTTVLVVPLAEELAFRGFLARRISKAAFDTLSPRAISALGIAVSSLAFGLLHERALAGFVAGVAYALAYRARGRLADAVVAHATTNAVLLVVALWTGDPRLAT